MLMVWTVVGLIIFVIVVVVYAGGCGSGMHLSAFVRVFNEGGDILLWASVCFGGKFFSINK